MRLRLLVLQTDVQRKDVRVLNALGHVGVTSTMIQNEPADELGLTCGPVLHLHNFNHVKVDGFCNLGFVGRRCRRTGLDGKNSVNYVGCQFLRQSFVQLRCQG